MGKRKKTCDLGTFHKEASQKGLTYAEAQMQESIRQAGRIRAPRGDDPDEVPYKKVSTWGMLRKKQGK